MTMITSIDFHPDKVRAMLRHHKVLNKVFLNQTKGKTGGHQDTLKSIFNALIRPDRKLMEEYTKIQSNETII